MYSVGLGESPHQIATMMGGTVGDLIAANPHKSVVSIGGQTTFAALGVGELINVPVGMADPGVVFDAYADAFGVGGDVGVDGPFDFITDNPVVNTVKAVVAPIVNAVKGAGEAAGEAAGSVANVAKSAGNAAANAVAGAINLASKVPADIGGPLLDKVAEAVKDPTGFAAKLAAGGPLAVIGYDNLEVLLRKAGIKPPSDIARSLGLPASPQEALHAVGLPATPQEALQRVNLPSSPEQLASRLGLPDVTKMIPSAPDPMVKLRELAEAAGSGDLDKIGEYVLKTGHELGDALAMVPGLGTPFAAALNAGIALLESGSPLRVVLEALLAAVPMPTAPINFKEVVFRPVIRTLSDTVEKGNSVTDAFLMNVKDGLLVEAKKKGLPDVAVKPVSDLVDGIIQVIVKGKPIDTAATDYALKGFEQAKAMAAKKFGANIPPAVKAEIDKLKQHYDQIKSVTDKAGEIYVATQGIKKLNGAGGRVTPTSVARMANAAVNAATNAATQKQINDLRVGIAAKNLALQSNHAGLRKFKPAIKIGKVRATPAPRPAAARPASAPRNDRFSQAPSAPSTAAQAIQEQTPSMLVPPAGIPAPPPTPSQIQQSLYSPKVFNQEQFARPVDTSEGIFSVSAPPRHGGGHRGGGGGGPSRGPWRPLPFPVRRAQGFGPHWGAEPWWAGRTQPIDQTCSAWGDPVAMSPAMVATAEANLTNSGGRPVVARSVEDAKLYLFAIEAGAPTARPCTAFGVGGC